MKQIKNLIIVSNTDAIQVYDYEVINNQLTELNIYSSGAEQLARNKKSSFILFFARFSLRLPLDFSLPLPRNQLKLSHPPHELFREHHIAPQINAAPCRNLFLKGC